MAVGVFEEAGGEVGGGEAEAGSERGQRRHPEEIGGVMTEVEI